MEEFAQLEHVIVSVRGGDFVTPVDNARAALGQRRNVVLSAASFLLVPEIVAHMVWHERSHGHGGQKWVREKLLAMEAAR